MALINIKNLSFSYQNSNKIFDNTSFMIDTNWKMGLIGRNGIGKTTLFKIFLDELTYSGVIIKDNIKFDHFPFPIENPNMLVKDILLARNPLTELWQLELEFNLLGLPLEKLNHSYNTLSNGEQTKACLAQMFANDNYFLLIDEPTNHLDALGLSELSDYLRQKKSFIVISHDRSFLDDTIDHVIAINKTSIEIQRGNFSSWYQNKENQNSLEIKQNEQLKKDITRLHSSKERTKNWSNQIESSKFGEHGVDRGYIGRKSADMMRRSKGIEKRMNQMITSKKDLLHDLEVVEALKPQYHPSNKNNLVILENLVINNPHPLNQALTTTIESGTKTLITGPNGSGKTSLIKLILGLTNNYSGQLVIANNLKISYVPQNFTNLLGTISDFTDQFKINLPLFLTILAKLGVANLDSLVDLATLSDGEKKKVWIAKSLSEPANLYIWDEPLNYLDVYARIQLEEMIQQSPMTLIFTEHDQIFVNKLATHRINLKRPV